MFSGKPAFASPRVSMALVSGLLLLFLAPVLRAAPDEARPVLTPADNQLLDDLESTGFRYFYEQAHPVTGLVRDRARADGSASSGKASIAASGFSFAATVIATERGWLPRTEAIERIRLKLQFLATQAPRQHGFFYHFMEMDTGARAWQCEVSSVDSSLLFTGAIVAREYFADPEITRLVNQLLAKVDWSWFQNQGELMTLSWHDETGFSRYRWNKFSEHILMSYLALGVSPHPVEAAYWQRWQRLPLGRYDQYLYLQSPPLFVYQFPLAYLDLRNRRDAYADYFLNARLATLAQRQFCISLRSEFPAWGENTWGVTASDSITGYKAWGGPPRTHDFNALDGTIVPCAAAGSLPFAPEETLAVLHHLRTTYGKQIWQRYGFVDAFNPQTGWVNPDVIGIDLGISLIQAENLRTGLIQRLFMQSPEARLALAKAGFLPTSRGLDQDQQSDLRSRAVAAWHSLQTHQASPGLQLTALIAALPLGLITAHEFLSQSRGLLNTSALPTEPAAIAQFAAGLITLRQAEPTLAPEVTRLLHEVSGHLLPAGAQPLGAASRLGVFLAIGNGDRPPGEWNHLDRSTVELGPVRVLAPTDVAGALLPGLWLDEHAILPGAAASQLAYASLTGTSLAADPFLPVLQLDQFPQQALTTPGQPPATPDAAAAMVITAANLLVHDVIRTHFQRDPLVQAGRSAIAEFGAATFGPNAAVIAHAELARNATMPAPRLVHAVAATRPRHEWDWQTVAGLAYLDSEADIRAGDSPLEFRFAVTWDRTALHFHADVTDAPIGYATPEKRKRLVELFIVTAGNELVWSGPTAYQFTYRLGSGPLEQFHLAVSQAKVTATEQGYTIEATIPWRSLGITPAPGMKFGLSPAAITAGRHEWEQTLKLNWSYAARPTGNYQLGRVELE